MMYKRAGGKSKKIQGREFKQALEDTVSLYMKDGVFELLPQGQFWDTLREKYAENLNKDSGENSIALVNITNHVRAKMSSNSLLHGGMIHRYLRSMGYETPPYPPSRKEARGFTQREWKNRFWSRQ